MNYFSLDLEKEKIYNPKTKEYFEEVAISYSVGNYRSAVVMLYSVVIADLLYKLQELKDRDEDTKAIEIINKIEAILSDKTRARLSEWENILINDVCNDTKLLEPHAKIFLERLKNLRNLCAHPVLNSDDLLFKPNMDTVRSEIRNALEQVLTVPAMYSGEIANAFMVKVPEYQDFYYDLPQYENYLKNKYFKLFNDKLTHKVFTNLWIAMFKGSSDTTKKNRDIYYTTMMLLYKSNHILLDQYFKDENQRHNNLLKLASDASNKIHYLLKFFKNAPHLYNEISEENKILILKDVHFSDVVNCGFIYESEVQHFEKIMENFNRGNLNYNLSEQVSEIVKSYKVEVPFYTACLEYLKKASTFNDGRSRWNYCLAPYLKELPLNFILPLLDILHENQNYSSAYWSDSYLTPIVDFMKSKNIEVDTYIKKYPLLQSCLSPTVLE